MNSAPLVKLYGSSSGNYTELGHTATKGEALYSVLHYVDNYTNTLRIVLDVRTIRT